MRYLANKKHQAHINTFLKIFLAVMTAITFASFCKHIFWQYLNEFRLQMFLLLAVALIYTLLRRFYLYATFLFLLLMINFYAISSVAVFRGEFSSAGTKLLFVPTVTDSNKLFDDIISQSPDIVAVSKVKTAYFSANEMIPEQYHFLHPADTAENGFMLSATKAVLSGRINLGHNTYAEFAKLNTGQNQTVFVAVDFSQRNLLEIDNLLGNLSTFVAEQDDPVVIFGDFNIVAWSRPLSKFISKHNLVIKNGLFDNLRNIFIPQNHYILAYEKTDISGQIALPYLNSLPLFTRF